MPRPIVALFCIATVAFAQDRSRTTDDARESNMVLTTSRTTPVDKSKATILLKAKVELMAARKTAIDDSAELRTIQDRIDALKNKQAELLRKLNDLVDKDDAVIAASPLFDAALQDESGLVRLEALRALRAKEDI